MQHHGNHRLVFVSGLSGAGKSVVLHTLEDLDFYCIDNFPIILLDGFSVQIIRYPKLIAIGINARNQESDIPVLQDCIERFNERGIRTELIFLEADTDILTKRYSETRRKHPFSGKEKSLQEAIMNERGLLSVLADIADIRIDTSHSTVHDLRRTVKERIAGKSPDTLSIQLVSFGYKHGVPRDADFIFDVRCLPNPYWDNRLRYLSGKDKPVTDYLSQQPLVNKMINQISTFLVEWIPCFEAENRSYLTIATGCTGGRHRSVFVADQISSRITSSTRQIIIRHRDL